MSADPTSSLPAGPAAPPPAFTPTARIDGMKPYSPSPADPRIDLRLDANEGPTLDPAVLDVLRSVEAETLRTYPSTKPLEAELAQRLSIDPARVVVTGGGDDAIDRICRVALDPGRELVLHTPTFEMIERDARLVGATVMPCAWTDGPFPVDAFLDLITPSTRLVALVTPNNPTGSTIPLEDILRVVAKARAVGALVLVDLAYVEFAQSDPTQRLLEEDSVVLVRTFSKAFSLAGLRVGYALGSAQVATWIRTVGSPYPVSAASLLVASRVLQPDPLREQAITRIREQREQLIAFLRVRGATLPESDANFLLARTPLAETIDNALRERGIAVRAFGNREHLTSCVRITAPGNDQQFARLMDALNEAFDPAPRQEITP